MKHCAPSWLYLQDYTRMHGQQNIKFDYSVPVCFCLFHYCMYIHYIKISLTTYMYMVSINIGHQT